MLLTSFTYVINEFYENDTSLSGPPRAAPSRAQSPRATMFERALLALLALPPGMAPRHALPPACSPHARHHAAGLDERHNVAQVDQVHLLDHLLELRAPGPFPVAVIGHLVDAVIGEDLVALALRLLGQRLGRRGARVLLRVHLLRRGQLRQSASRPRLQARSVCEKLDRERLARDRDAQGLGARPKAEPRR